MPSPCRADPVRPGARRPSRRPVRAPRPERKLRTMSCHALRILIVDDERELAEGLAEMLALLGYPVDIAGDERDALARARARTFNIAFVDSRMPMMHGSDLLDRKSVV